MAGFDDHVGIVGDWMPPSPSPRTIFSAMMGNDYGSRSNSENKNWPLFPGEQMGTPNDDNNRDGAQNGVSVCQANKLSSSGGLMERRAARAGFNAPKLNTESIKPMDFSHNPGIRSPYLTIPPGLSPTSLLDSPVFLSNSQAQPSPTTGQFPLVADKSKDSLLEDISTSSFAFKPVADSGPCSFFGAANKVTPSTFPRQSFQSNVEPSEIDSQDVTETRAGVFSNSSAEKGNNILSESEARAYDTLGGSSEHSPPLCEQEEEGEEAADHRGSGDPNFGGGPSEDGYNWRKYGQKQVKGSEYPRSYYKCTHPDCPIKKKVERSHEGQITEIIYNGTHNHPKPPPNRRSALGSLDISEQTGHGVDGDHPGFTAMPVHNKVDNHEVSSTSAAMGHALGGPQLESGDAVDVSSTFSNDEDEDDGGAHGSASLGGCDGEGDESESKRRKIEAYVSEMSGATRAIREPRVVVQTTSEVDILDDGYRWRKYGQKVVKGNPNPRSYYKCTSTGCNVRKHVERASHDLKSVITTYEGKHNHDVPAARNAAHVLSQSGAGAGAQSHLTRTEPAQFHNGMSRFERPPPSFRQQLGPANGFNFGMNHHQPNLGNLGMARLGPNQGHLLHPYLGHARPPNGPGFMFPKEEPKVEPLSEPAFNLSNSYW